MQVHVRNIAATCRKCGGDDFATSSGKRFELASQTSMRCTSCGTVSTYIELIMQIAEKAVAISAATLEEIRRKRGQ